VDCHIHHAEQKCTQPQEITPLHGAFAKNLYFAFYSDAPTRFFSFVLVIIELVTKELV
jgi:hypothetical protein